MDTKGFVLKAKVHSAKVMDQEGLISLLERAREQFLRLQHLCSIAPSEAKTQARPGWSVGARRTVEEARLEGSAAGVRRTVDQRGCERRAAEEDFRGSRTIALPTAGQLGVSEGSLTEAG